MSNSIDLVVSKQAQDGVKELVSALTQADELILKFSSDALAFNKTVSNIKTPADLSAQSTRNKQLTEQTITALNEQNKIEKQLIATIEKKSIATEGTNRELQKQRTLLAQTNKDVANQVKENLGLISSYDKLSQELTTLRNQAKATAVTFGLESAEFKKQAVAVQELDGRLKKIDQTLGQSQRNVGNYKSGFNGLGNSINQLTRELPAFTFSAQTGFLALSNNIPILTDQIGQLVNANKLLAAEGKPTVSVFKQIISQVLSFNTVLALVILGTTLFGKQIGEFADKLFSTKDRVSELEQQVLTLNKAFDESSVKDVTANVDELRINIGLAKEGFLDKNKVVEQYNETIGKTTGFVKTLDEAERELTKNGDAYIKMTLYKAAANLALNEAAKATVEAERTRQKQLEEFENKFLDAQVTTIRSREQYDQTVKQIEKNRRARQAEEVKINEQNANKNLNIAKKFQQDAAEIAKKFNFNFFGDNEADKKAKKVAEEKRQAETNSLAAFEENLRALKEEQALLDVTTDKYKILTNLIGLLETIKKRIGLEPIDIGFPELATEIETPAIDTKETKESIDDLKKDIADYLAYLKKLRDDTDTYSRSFGKSFIEESGFSELNKFFDGTFNKLYEGAKQTGDEFFVAFEAITEAGQQAFNTLNQLSAQNYDMERQRLDSQTKIAIANANGSDKAIKEIERQAEIRRRAIARREAQANKKTASFNVAINAAQGIVATFKDGFSVKAVVFAAALAAIAAVQIAAINAQQVPQYWQGGVHSGGLMMVNDDPHGRKGSNYKEVIRTPDGKVHRPQGRNVLMNAPKGTEIFKDEASFQAQYDNLIASVGISPYRDYQQRQAQQSAFPIQEFREVGNQIAQSVRNIPQHGISIDKQGVTSWVRTESGVQQSMNNRTFHKGAINP